MEYHDCPLIILFENKNDKNEPEHQIELPNQIDKFDQAYDQNQYDRKRKMIAFQSKSIPFSLKKKKGKDGNFIWIKTFLLQS